ncbi:MAG: fibronectin type III domain-containing protein [bacterium]|jgi:hypothetical protein
MKNKRFPLAFACLIILAQYMTPCTHSAEEPISAAIATNATSGHNVLTWSYNSTYSGYNVYRKTDPLPGYNDPPLNGDTPITIMTDCNEIRNVIPEGSTEWNMLQTISGDVSAPFDPCLIAGLTSSATEFQRLQMLARGSWNVAVVAGQGYYDTLIVPGTTYYYEIRGINAVTDQEETLVSDLQVTSGVPLLPPPPASVTAQPGDSRVLVMWDDVPDAAGFYVLRSINPVGPYRRVNDSPLITEVTDDLYENPLPESTKGFIDFQRWDLLGNPVSHIVNGFVISGPINNVTYYYQVSSIDVFGQESGLSASTAIATPTDQTPPMTPQDIDVTARDIAGELEVRFQIVTHDVDGHRESSIQGYRVYRYDNPEILTGVDISGLVPHPAPGIQYLTVTDNDPILRPPYGEQTFWYRIICIDGNGNESSLSASAAGFLMDITPPDSPQGVSAEGFEEFIRVYWQPNTEPDLDGYLIYRSLCDFGEWLCFKEPYYHENPDTGAQITRCPEVFKLVGYISQEDALQIIEDTGGLPYFDDLTVPEGSPLCYAYLVKALDESQNESGTLPPDPNKEIIVCQRLRDRTPPEAAVITAAMARDQQIHVEWIGAPVQDIAAYHVYRAPTLNGPYQFVGGMTVPVPPAPGVFLNSPYEPPAVVGCDTIPIAVNEDMSSGSLIDKVDPKVEYFYKVVGVDQVGNEGRLEDAVGISTFTFSTAQPTPPLITAITEATPECALIVEWEPALSGTSQGFIVFRSTTNAAGPYRQISELLPTNEFVDVHVVEGVEYWYKVLQIDGRGNLSPQSIPESGQVTH